MTGRPAPVLASYASESGHDLVAVGAHGTGLSTAVLGSVAEQLVQRGDVPVLIGSTASGTRGTSVGAHDRSRSDGPGAQTA